MRKSDTVSRVSLHMHPIFDIIFSGFLPLKFRRFGQQVTHSQINCAVHFPKLNDKSVSGKANVVHLPNLSL